jgi:hypothetical protein
MKIKEVIEKLTEIYDKEGNIDLLVDTEGAEYICHMVEVTGVWTYPEVVRSEIGNACYLSLDNETKLHRGQSEGASA